MQRLGIVLGVVNFGIGIPTYHQPHDLLHGETPSREQLTWMDKEIGGYVFFGIGMPGGPWIPKGDGCSNGREPPPAEDFKVGVDIHGWYQALININAGYSILPVSGSCGHLLWDTNVKIPQWGTYNYTARQSSLGPIDVVAEFVNLSQKAGISPGVHFSMSQNYWLGWNKTIINNGKFCPKISFEQYVQVTESLLTELWGKYPWTEIWFEKDSFVGFGKDDISKITSKIKTLNPSAVLLRGPGNEQLLRGIGNEQGAVSQPNYLNAPSSHYTGPGVFTGGVVAPDEGFVPFSSNFDNWWAPNQSIKTLIELANEHDSTVGLGANLLIGITPNYTGSIPDQYLSRYREFGEWRVTCYHEPFAEINGSDEPSIVFKIPIVPDYPPLCDRIWLREDISQGLRITNFTVEVQVSLEWRAIPWLVPCSSYSPCSGNKTFGFESVTASVFNGTTVGHKRIIRFARSEISALPLNITAVRVNSSYHQGNPATYKSIGLFPAESCTDPYLIDTL